MPAKVQKKHSLIDNISVLIWELFLAFTDL